VRLIRRSVARCVAVGALLLATLLAFGTPAFADSDSPRPPEIVAADHARTIESPREHTDGGRDTQERTDREGPKDKDRDKDGDRDRDRDREDPRDKPDHDRNSPDDGGVCPP